MRNLLLLTLSLLAVALASAQPTVAPTDAPVGPPRGQELEGYNIVQSFETGYRFREVDGNLGRYRSDVNFGNGVRLLSSNLSVNSRDGHGKYFDELLINTQGLGNDPYQFASLRVQKNQLYRYDLLWRSNQYFNPGLTVANGLHRIDTDRSLQDHNFVLLPQSSFRLLAGHSRAAQTGPALSTVDLFLNNRDQFPTFVDVARRQNEYRLGAEASLFGTKLSFIRAWEAFKDDTERSLSGAEIELFRRTEPVHGTTGSWRVHLVSEQTERYSWNGRFTQSDGRREFVFDEFVSGSGLNAGINRQILVFGHARRPVTTAALTINLFPTERITIANHTAFHNTRMEGDGRYADFDNRIPGVALYHFQHLGIRTLVNSTDANLRIIPQVALVAGYSFSNRRIQSKQQEEIEGFITTVNAEQENSLHVGRVGIRLRPVRPFSIVLDAEIGRADQPIYPISNRSFHALNARGLYRTRRLQISASARTFYNTNSVSLAAHSARSRNYAADLSWNGSRFGFDASYSKLHLDTLTGIAYFFNRTLVADDRSRYISNIHSGTATVRLSAGRRTDVFLGYTRVQDTGDDGRRLQFGSFPSLGTEPPQPGTLAYQAYPLSYESPMGRVSVRLHPKIRLNFGYQYYRYDEELLPVQNYRAHTGFTSLLWSF